MPAPPRIPRKPPDQLRSRSILLRLTEAEVERWQARALELGVTVSDLVRQAVRAYRRR